MSRIVLTTLGSLGDVHPFIALGLGLRDRGHTIVFATTKDYQTIVESLGFEFHSIRPDHAVDDPSLVALMMDPRRGTERVLRDYLLGNLRQTYADLLSIVQNADLIVSHEIIYAIPLLAELFQIRWAVCILGPGSFFSVYDPFVMPFLPALAKLRVLGPGINQRVKDFAKFMTRGWGEPVHQLRQELNLSPISHPIFEDKFSPYLVLALFSSVLGSPQQDWPPNTIVTGFTFYDGSPDEELAPELKQFLEKGEPPIVFTLGSAAVVSPGNFYEVSIQAAKILNRRAVLMMGHNPPPENLPTTLIAINYAPFSKIFPYACAIVHQGGVGTTAQALRAGHPTLVMPYSHDQPDNAARVERLGTSRTISRKAYSTVKVVKELNRLLDTPSYREKAAEVGRIIQAENGVKVACDEIEKQIHVLLKEGVSRSNL